MVRQEQDKVEGLEGEGQAQDTETVEEQATPTEATAQEGTPVEAGEGQPPVDELAALRQELEETRAKQAEYLDGWQRARAELSNARKRFQRDQEQAHDYARADVLACLLPIVDDFERAFDTLPADASTLNWVDGVRLIQHKLQNLLQQEGVTPIETAGREFDPFLHQALTHEPSDTVPEGHVISEMQKGYQIGDRVLRPSVVRVSSGPPAEPQPGESPKENGS